jgi:hypothetical protein
MANMLGHRGGSIVQTTIKRLGRNIVRGDLQTHQNYAFLLHLFFRSVHEQGPQTPGSRKLTWG